MSWYLTLNIPSLIYSFVFHASVRSFYDKFFQFSRLSVTTDKRHEEISSSKYENVRRSYKRSTIQGTHTKLIISISSILALDYLPLLWELFGTVYLYFIRGIIPRSAFLRILWKFIRANIVAFFFIPTSSFAFFNSEKIEYLRLLIPVRIFSYLNWIRTLFMIRLQTRFFNEESLGQNWSQ